MGHAEPAYQRPASCVQHVISCDQVLCLSGRFAEYRLLTSKISLTCPRRSRAGVYLSSPDDALHEVSDRELDGI